MKKTYLFFVFLCLFSIPAMALDVVITADVSCRTEGGSYVDTNRADSSKLSVRNTSNGNKSWIKFSNLGTYDLSKVRAATLTVSLHEPKAGANQFDVSFVNDNCLDNINWTRTSITWNNAPGNLRTDLGLLDPTKTAFLQTVYFTDGIAGDTFFINVLPAIQSDTDGIVQFVLHNSPLLINLSTHNHATVAWRPKLILKFPPLGADWPNPPDGANRVQTSLSQLSWTNPDPNIPGQPIYCDVYFGTDPNRLLMDKKTLGNNISSVALTAANFPRFAPLINNRTYYWVVDCYDTVKGKIEGEMWSFYTNNNQPPYDVYAGADRATWLDSGQASVTLIGSAQDDGRPIPPGQLSYLWERTAGPTSAVINSPNASTTTVNFTAAGDYTFRLTVSDGEFDVSDTVRIVVGTNSCSASHLFYGTVYNPSDFDRDCVVDLADLQILVNSWLVCDNTLGSCR